MGAPNPTSSVAPELIGVHTNMPAVLPAEIEKALATGGPLPAGLSADEKHAYEQVDSFYKHGLGYAQEMAGRPQTLYALADSPVGLAAWMLDHDIKSYELIARVFNGQSEGLTRNDISTTSRSHGSRIRQCRRRGCTGRATSRFSHPKMCRFPWP